MKEIETSPSVQQAQAISKPLSQMGEGFVPGARVAIEHRFTDDVREGFVEKVYKNGNFILRGSTQQWKPHIPSPYAPQRWTASQTGGNGYGRGHLTLWNEAADAELSERKAKAEHKRRFYELRKRFERLSPDAVGADILDAIQNALDAADASSKATGA